MQDSVENWVHGLVVLFGNSRILLRVMIVSNIILESCCLSWWRLLYFVVHKEEGYIRGQLASEKQLGNISDLKAGSSNFGAWFLPTCGILCA